MATSALKREKTGEGLILNNMTELMTMIKASSRLYIPVVTGVSTALSSALAGVSQSGMGIFKNMDTRIDYIVFNTMAGQVTLGKIDPSTQEITINQKYVPSPLISSTTIAGKATAVFHIPGTLAVLFYKRGIRYGLMIADTYANGSVEFISNVEGGVIASLEAEPGDEYLRKLSVTNNTSTVMTFIVIGATRVT